VVALADSKIAKSALRFERLPNIEKPPLEPNAIDHRTDDRTLIRRFADERVTEATGESVSRLAPVARRLGCIC